MKKRKRIAIYGSALTLIMLTVVLFLWKASTESFAYHSPSYQQREIERLLYAPYLTTSDYQQLYFQTGLGKSVVDKLREMGREEEILYAQKAFFAKPEIVCRKSSMISWEERNVGKTLPKLLCLMDGDILITNCSHTFGWRNGHAALVVDAKKGLTLESVVLGQPSCLQKVEKWRGYPSFLVLRLKDTTMQEREAIAKSACETALDVNYGFSEDLLEHWGLIDEYSNTDCSHLVWKAFKRFGYDLDSDGGIFVTPKDIAQSPLLEIVQSYGIVL